MCRLACFPPGFPRSEAIRILFDFQKNNYDGVGSAYIKNGKFVVEKYPKSLSNITRNGKKFLSHMPYNGWTIAHLRAASHGDNTYNNTHPFLVGDWAFMHNGIWSEYGIVKLALEGQITLKGETDTEVAAHLFNIAGPKKFAQEVSFGGVFVGLNKTGALWVAKTSGQLEMFAVDQKRVLLASELDGRRYRDTLEALTGWYHFDKTGKYVASEEVKNSFFTEMTDDLREDIEMGKDIEAYEDAFGCSHLACSSRNYNPGQLSPVRQIQTRLY